MSPRSTRHPSSPVRIPAVPHGRRQRRSRAWLLVVLGWFMLATLGVAERREHPVGRAHAAYSDDSRQDWNDPTRPRPLSATVWYPSARDSREQPWQAGVFEFGMIAPDAPMPAGVGRLPLVLVSHGTGGSAPQLSWLAEALAGQGFLVAGVNHHGNTAAEARTLVAGFTLWWERARDVSVLLDRLLADPRFADLIDPDRIGVAGFSIGGFTAMLLAGARVDLDAFHAHCREHSGDHTCRPPPESAQTEEDFQRFLAGDRRALASLRTAADSYRDPRVRAAFVMAPALMPALSDESLRGLDLPVQVVTGAADTLVLPGFVQALAQRMDRVDIDALPGVGHYAFLAPCNDAGVEQLARFCVDAPGIDRRHLHHRVAAHAVAFFKRQLCQAHRNDAAAGTASDTHEEVDPCSTP